MPNILDAIKGLFAKKQLNVRGPNDPQQQNQADDNPFLLPKYVPPDPRLQPGPSPFDEEWLKERELASQGTQRAQKQYDDAYQRTNTPYPKMASSDPTDAETIAGLLGQFLGPQNPGARSRAANAPFQIAQGRAQQQNAYNQDQYQAQSQNNRTMLDASKAVLDMNMSREDSLDRVKGQLQQKQMAEQAKQTTAAAKADQTFRIKLSEMLGKGQANIQSVAQLLIGMGTDPQVAAQSAQDIIQSVQQDPSFQMQLQSDKLALKQEHEDNQKNQDTIKRSWDTVKALHKGMGDPDEAAAAYGKLIQAGELPENFNIDAAIARKTEVQKGMDAGTANKEANTKKILTLLPAQTQKAVSDAKLSEKQVQMLDKRLASFDEDLRSRLAVRTAQIGKLSRDKATTPKQSIQALNGLKSIYNEQITRLNSNKKDADLGLGEFTAADQARLDELTKNLQDLEVQYQSAVSAQLDAGSPFTGSLQTTDTIKPPSKLKTKSGNSYTVSHG